LNALHALIKTGAVVQMQSHRDLRFPGREPGHGCYVIKSRVFNRALAGLHDHRSVFLFGRGHDGLDDLHVVAIERAYRITAFPRLAQEDFDRN